MLTPATITVNFTANYKGLHRICWRQCNVGAYVCTNLVDCVGGENVCSATVSIMVDPESCTPVCFEGYIQATCNPEGSPVDQVPWSATFVPSPACKPFRITCNSGDPLVPCGVITSQELGLNCNGTARPQIDFMNNGSSILVCGAGVIPVLPQGYTMTEEDACCYDCTQYSATITPDCPTCDLSGSFMYYMDCTTRELVKVPFAGMVPVLVPPFCAVTGSVSLQLNFEASGVVNTIGPCP